MAQFGFLERPARPLYNGPIANDDFSRRINILTHPLVDQLRFARLEFKRCLEGVTARDAVRRLTPMNCISWIIGHLANQEHFYWVVCAQAMNVAPELDGLVGFGKPASTPPLEEMWDCWQLVTRNADAYLNKLDGHELVTHLNWKDRALRESVGTMLQRNIYHYWFHTGEAHAIRQQLGHPDLPQFVGNMSSATFRTG